MAVSFTMDLVYSLVGYPEETEWLEFKENFDEADRLGKDVSALANAAAFRGRDFAYKIWGVEDITHRLIGTTFNPLASKAKGNQDLQIWLKRMLSANANYEFGTVEHEGKSFVVLAIHAACHQPVYFNNVAYIREGSSTTKLVAGSAKEAEFWRRVQKSDFELQAAEENLFENEVMSLLDVETYYRLIGQSLPSSSEARMLSLVEQELVRVQDDGRYAISNLGALLVARKLSVFGGLRKRVLRIIRFAGKGSFEILGDTFFDEGYALALQSAEAYFEDALTAGEESKGAFRKIVSRYPRRALRELLVNAVAHQDLTVTTSGPLVGIYSNRIEFSNPGVCLLPTNRVLNAQPKTRNIRLVNQLRQMDLCEEGGTGWDLAVASCEAAHILPPRMETGEELGTKVTLFEGIAYERMTKRERMDAAYWHACLLYAQGESMGNQSLRERFGLNSGRKETVAISRLIRDCCQEGLIKEEDADAGAKFKRYIPAWA